ncbi:Ribosomal protein S18 acetylase RimI and related acetyltransferases [Nostoc flagelliforme CCNUN1]|uniref:Ribosomal protein S18 acetylase RimI and related acetyltransferases n=1 Tax=Nostoc flagelliforme CCNUN1 TaxID=2038116 RepID=A0A2K8SPW7_9NOSO|nr:GNAT family N-acetyltransferase [Nostoc flagelliforme]AUB37471.1 Ribosomal protein S18 acetylase RimI and related acetyltransferases [Nostoc flagelliforme CCNUN1]
MDFSIRKAVVGDALAIAQILQELGWHSWLIKLPHDEVVKQIKSSILLCNADNSHSVYVAENSESKVLGYITVHWMPCLFLEKLRGHVSDLFVSEGSRRQGVGTALLEAVATEAQARESGSITALVRDGGEAHKQGFYRKVGWVEHSSFVSFMKELVHTIGVTTSSKSY